MARAKKRPHNRDGVRFLALPHVVLDSPAFLGLSPPAIRLLIDIGRQYDGKNNGHLVASMGALSKRGWNSNDTLMRARRELQDVGLIFETRKGARPNRAAWYGLTWLPINWDTAMDIQPASFRRGAYLNPIAT